MTEETEVLDWERLYKTAQNRSDIRHCRIQELQSECKQWASRLCKTEDERDALRKELDSARDLVTSILYDAKTAVEQMAMHRRHNAVVQPSVEGPKKPSGGSEREPSSS